MTNVLAARSFFARFAIGKEPNGVRPDQCGEWIGLAGVLWDTYQVRGMPAAQQMLQTWLNDPKQSRGLSALMAGIDEDAAAIEPMPAYPDLPLVIDFTQGAGAGGWLNTYSDYAAQVSPMTPRSFHESAGLWLASIAVARRLKVKMPFGDIYPNLWIAWIAPTTLWNKTTALNVARGLVERAFPHMLASQDTTPEALISDMAGAELVNKDSLPDEELALWKAGRDFCGQRGCAIDEISGFVSRAEKEYNAGLLETFMSFYDCEHRYVRSTKGGGRTIIRNTYLSLLGASTPAVMSQYLVNERHWSMGWWPRFAILTPDQDRPPWIPAPGYINEPPELLKELHGLYRNLPRVTWPEYPEAQRLTLGKRALETWDAYNKVMRYDLLTDELDRRLWGTYGRLPTQVIKLATLLAAMDWRHGDVPIMETAHMIRAIQIAECWRMSAHRALKTGAVTEANNIRARITKHVAHAEPIGATVRELHRAMQDVDVQRLEIAVAECLRLGEIEEVRSEAGQRGRPTTRYRLPRL